MLFCFIIITGINYIARFATFYLTKSLYLKNPDYPASNHQFQVEILTIYPPNSNQIRVYQFDKSDILSSSISRGKKETYQVLYTVLINGKKKYFCTSCENVHEAKELSKILAPLEFKFQKDDN